MLKRKVLALVGAGLVMAIVAAACSGGSSGGGGGEDAVGGESPAEGGTPSPTATPPETTPGPPGDDEDIPDVVGWATNWAKRSIDPSELSKGLFLSDPRDVIQPIDNPQFETVAEASAWLVDREPVLLLELNGDARAYPLQILTWHEIVNDEVGGLPVAVTFCPLCNTAIVFERTVNGEVLRLGTSGLLRNSDLVMWDRQTESLWQQITGEAIVGDMTGTTLEFVPASLIPFSEFKASFPEGQVLSRQTGFARSYGANPYTFYSSSTRPFLFSGDLDDRFPALERVVAVIVNDQEKAYPFSVISQEGAVNDEVAGVPIVVFWGATDTADALDTTSIAEAKAIGAGLAYERTVDGQVLTFTPVGDAAYRDNETGTVWNILGIAQKGPLAGQKLPPVIHANHFWFAWAAFNQGDPVYTGSA